MTPEPEESHRRNHLERIEDIFAFMDKQPDVFPKSDFKHIGLNPRTAEMWLKLIVFVQNQPRIRLIQTDHNLLVEKVEGKYQTMMRKKSLDENISFEQRLQHFTDYLKSSYTREKVKLSSELTKKKGLPQETPKPDELISDILAAFAIFIILDPTFSSYIQVFTELGINPSEEAQFKAISMWTQKILLNKAFQAHLKSILNQDSILPKLGKITTEHPHFITDLTRAKQTIKNYYEFLHENIADWFFE